ncbi:SurA N-terminal domain-containing protein [Qipengyuania sp. S6317L1]|uniref:SurA N-terminal domain-containing protein n=1 Tax=Qipengyuania sp. S6317L1 TaxID=2926410 RepID=UPI001FF5EC18|nr:SurA N-terminal domain-containing protein [Qipengyuania sp. S6317L1]MCK0099505.1 SurA N-terminal domain-containing protein [Qipengyuania sp. S6317L1]
MISLFRNFFQSKIGLPIFIGFLIIVALAFAASDISGSATFGGLSGDDKIAAVGGDTISANEANGAVNSALDRARQQNPTITMPQFIEQGGYASEIDVLIDRYALGFFARDIGLRAGDNLVNSEILQIPAFRNLTGEFDSETYQAALRRQGITDSILRKDIADGLLAQQILRPALGASTLPKAAAKHYASLVLERRKGQVGLISALAYAPEEEPNNEVLGSFYSSNREDFILPERRTLRFAAFGADKVTANLEASDAEIAARFKQDAEQYDAQERRSFSSFVVPTEEAAKALTARIRSGTSLEAAAAEAGFNVSTSELRDQEQTGTATSFAIAEKVFSTPRGTVIDPARSALGWYVARVDQIENTPARTLGEVRSQIAEQIRGEKLAAALIDLSSRIEEQVDTGTSLTDVAEEFGLEVITASNITANGTVFGTQGQSVSQAVRPLVDTAFQMEEGNPQLAEVVLGAQFVVFDVSEITESAAPPLAEVKQEVAVAWRLAEGGKKARKVADKVQKAIEGGASIRDAMSDAGVDLRQIQNIDLTREELLQQSQGRVPSAVVLLFSMAQGSTKVLEDQNGLGWFVVNLDEISVGEVEDDNPLLEQTRQQIGNAIANEYASQLSRSVREEVGVERNEEAIEALRRNLAGES